MCGKPASPLSFGMCHNRYNACVRSGRPDLRSWASRRRKWLRQHSTLKCDACDGPHHTDLPWHGDMARYRAWVTTGRPEFDRALDRSAGPEPRDCLVFHRPTAQVCIGMDQNCYKACCTAGRPDRDNWARRDERGSTGERDFRQRLTINPKQQKGRQ